MPTPPQAQRRVNGGRAWAERYRAMSLEERQRIIALCVLGRLRQHARKNGYPDPIAFTFVPAADEKGDIAAKPGEMRPMTDEEIAAL